MSTVARIALVSPNRSRQIETILLRMAQMGQLKGRVGEEQLIELLEQVSHFTSISVNYLLRALCVNITTFHVG